MTAKITRDFRLQTPEYNFSHYATKELERRRDLDEGMDEIIYQKAVDLVIEKLNAMHVIPEDSHAGDELFAAFKESEEE